MSGFAASVQSFSDFLRSMQQSTVRRRGSLQGRGGPRDARQLQAFAEGPGGSQATAVSEDELSGFGFGRFLLGEEQFVFKELGDFVFVVHCPASEGQHAVGRQLSALVALLAFLRGPADMWTSEALRELSGLAKVVDGLLLHSQEDPASLVGGTPFVTLASHVREKLDQTLGVLESDDVILGSLLLAGDEVLYSRLKGRETRSVRQIARLLPLGHRRARVTPVFCEGQWRNLVLLRMRWHTLGVLLSVDFGLVDVLPRLERFEARLTDRLGPMQVPLAPAEVHIDDMCDIQVVGFVFKDASKGQTFFPGLREDPSKQRDTRVLTWFMQRALDDMKAHGVTSVHLSKAGYRFFASEKDGFELYLLCGSQLSTLHMEAEAERIVAQVRMTYAM